MTNNSLKPRSGEVRLVVVLSVSVLVVLLGAASFGRRSAAQSPVSSQPLITIKPVLLSETNSTRAIALESVTHVKEPFQLNAPVKFSADNRTRVKLFAMYMYLNSDEDYTAVAADAEDAQHKIYPLQVEGATPVPGQEWMTAITVRLSDDMKDLGDVLVRVKYHGVESNRVRVAIGHVGGGPPDDKDAAPTPAKPNVAPTPNTNPITAGNLTASDVQTVIAQAVSAAVALNKKVNVAVVDREGNVLGVFNMTDAPATTRFDGGRGFNPTLDPLGLPPQGLEGANLPSVLQPATLAAISKAGTSAFFSTFGNAFTPRTAGFIIQEHLPPGIDNQAGGPLYGVQFSSLPCTDVKAPATLPFGLSADPGAVPLYKNGVPSGGVGIEGDGVYTIDRNVFDDDKPFEELIAVAAGRGYEPPAQIRGDQIIVNGIRLPYLNVTDSDAPRPALIPFASLPGTVNPSYPIRGAQPSEFVPATLGGVQGTVDTRFPIIDSPMSSPNKLTKADVTTILAQAAQQADRTRAAIRQPLGSPARVNITVVDRDGNILGIFRTQDAPVFGFDVSAQKARTAAFNSRPDAGALLRAAGQGSYVDRAAADGVRFDGSIAFSDRAGGFLHRPFYPDGINGTDAGPLSTPYPQWSVFNVGLQLDLDRDGLVGALVGANVRCTKIPQIPNGIQIFAGSVPLYRNGELIGGVGISGDGIDQDDIIGSAGSQGYEAPVGIRADQFYVRGTRLPFVKFPRSPDL